MPLRLRALLTLALLFPVPSFAGPTTAPQSDIDHNAATRQEFLAFDPHYKENLQARITKATPLGMQVYIREKLGQNVQYSHQILSELIWLFESTADYDRIDQRLEDLKQSIDHPELQQRAAEQDPTDGSFGAGYTEWFF